VSAFKPDRADYNAIVAFIIDYMQDTHDLPMGQFEAESFLDSLAEKVMPAIYNQALEDAQRALRDISERLEMELDAKRMM